MAAPFHLLFGLLILLAYPTGVEPLRFAGGPAAPVAALLILVVHGGASAALRGRGSRLRGLLSAAALLEYAVLVFGFHWPLWTWLPWVESSPLLSTLAGLAPLLALAALQGGLLLKPGHRAFAFRASAGLAFAPLLAMLSAQELMERVPVLKESALLMPSLAGLASWAAVFAVGAALPRLLRFVFGAIPMEAGPLRDRLEARCRAMGFVHGGLFVVPSGGTANAFVAGLFPGRRPLFFTEALIAGLSPAGLEGVLAHEVTHARRGHLGAYLMLGAAFAGLGGGAQALVPGMPDWAVLGAAALGGLLFWGVLFREVSRRFESEADLGAAKALSGSGDPPYGGAPAMIEALVQVAALNGTSLGDGSWRHHSPARRIGILQRAWEAPAEGESWERTCRRVRGIIAAAFCFALAGGIALGVSETRGLEGRRRWVAGLRTAEMGGRLLSEGRSREALERFREALEAGVDGAPVWRGMAAALRSLGRSEEAIEAEGCARVRSGPDPRERRLNLAP